MSFDLKITNKNFSLVNGDFAKVTDTDKLVQDVLKIILTPINGNPLFAWYGSYLSFQVIGMPNSDPRKKQVVAQTQIQNALEKLKKLQDQQINTYQNVSSAEQIAAIKSINVALDSNDPRRYIVSIDIVAKDLKPQQPIVFAVKIT